LAGIWLTCALYGQPVSVLEKRLDLLEKTLLLDPSKFERILWQIRRPPVSIGERTALIAALPEEGHVRTVTPDQAGKIRALRPVFELLGRQPIYQIQIIDVPQAFLGLHARTVILVSVNALDLLAAAELSAVAAHEAGHEFFWDEYAQARAAGSESALRRIELLADAVAVLTLNRIEIDAEVLIAGLRKLSEFNQSRLGSAFNTNMYPSLETRASRILDLNRRIANRPMRKNSILQTRRR
jgi:Zn-dependent protease with chaperone function